MGMHGWHRITWDCDRPNFLAWRDTSDGSGDIEILAYDYGFGYSLEKSIYVERASSLEAIGGVTKVPQ
jgi:hypothetical protein